MAPGLRAQAARNASLSATSIAESSAFTGGRASRISCTRPCSRVSIIAISSQELPQYRGRECARIQAELEREGIARDARAQILDLQPQAAAFGAQAFALQERCQRLEPRDHRALQFAHRTARQ